MAKGFTTDRLRNVALIAHGGAGKTSLAEMTLYLSGATSRLGSVDQGTAVTDYDPEEVRRKISINTALAPIEWKEHKINLIDTPGYFDFVGEVKGALRVADAAVLLLCAASGVEVGSEQVWQYAEEQGLPRLAFVNKLDRENANFRSVLGRLKELYGTRVVAVQIPMGESQAYKGIIDLVEMKAYFDEGAGKMREAEIPGELAGEAEGLREALIEAAASTDDALTEKYLEEGTLSAEEIRSALARGVRTGEIVPVLCGSALKGGGVARLLDYVVAWLPSPLERPAVKGTRQGSGEPVELPAKGDGPLAALVFKTMADPYVGRLTLFRVWSGTLRSDSTVYNASKDRDERLGQLFFLRGKEQVPTDRVAAGDIGAVAKLQETGTGDTLTQKDMAVRLEPIVFPKPVLTLAVEPKSKGDEDKIGSGLARLAEEDPTFTVNRNVETSQTVISGMGEVHLEVVTSRLQKKFGVEVALSTPRIPYRETIRGSAKVEGKYKKQTGGRGQYGHVWLELEPLTEQEFEFVDKIVGGVVPRQYIPAVEKGVRETMAEGVLAGYPVTNVRVSLYDGSYHSVDSSELAFKVAASMAFKKGFMEASPVLLEPIVQVEVVVPEAYMGDVIGDLNKKRGKILGMDPQGGLQVIRALAPLAEMSRYAIDLRSMTQGRARFSMSFHHYEEVPAHLAEQIIEAASRERNVG